MEHTKSFYAQNWQQLLCLLSSSDNLVNKFEMIVAIRCRQFPCIDNLSNKTLKKYFQTQFFTEKHTISGFQGEAFKIWNESTW